MIGVIGCGNMASAIVQGIHAKYEELEFLTYTPSFTRAQKLAQEVKGKACRELKELDHCHTLVIGCKPQQFAELALNLNEQLDLTGKHIVSIMAAMPIASIQKVLNVQKVTRVMPNTPCALNQGVSLILHADRLEQKEKSEIRRWFDACSKTFVMQTEAAFDQATTVTGSGPAYVFEFAKSMADKLAQWGHDESVSREMVAQLFKGAASLMESKSDLSFEDLVAQVTSKGGVTIEAIKTYRDQNLADITSKALDAAYERSVALTRDLGGLDKV